MNAPTLSPDLPPLPHPCIYVTHDTETVYCGDVPRDKVPPHDDFYSADKVREYAAEAIAAANRRAGRAGAAVPPGYVLVPAEPTQEMERAGMNCEGRSTVKTMESPRLIYKAMLSAATGSPASATGNSDQQAILQDALRYRWLRDGEIVAEYPYPVIRMNGGDRFADRTIWAEELDAAVDAAMSASTTQPGGEHG